MRGALLTILCGALALGCPKKKVDPLEIVITDAGASVAAASPAAVAIPPTAPIAVIGSDRVFFDDYVIFPFDAARAATEGVDAKYKKKAGDPYIVPLANVASSYVDRARETKKLPIALLMTNPKAPAKVEQEVLFTLRTAGLTQLYRVVRRADGSLAADPIPP